MTVLQGSKSLFVGMGLLPLVLNEGARIENACCLRQPNALDPCGIDNIHWESSQAWSPDIVPVGFDGMRNACQKVRRSLFPHQNSPNQYLHGTAAAEWRSKRKTGSTRFSYPSSLMPGSLRCDGHRLPMRQRRCLARCFTKPRARL